MRKVRVRSKPNECLGSLHFDTAAVVVLAVSAAITDAVAGGEGQWVFVHFVLTTRVGPVGAVSLAVFLEGSSNPPFCLPPALLPTSTTSSLPSSLSQKPPLPAFAR